ncbi:unnamed protein product [Rhizopus stolonifer]
MTTSEISIPNIEANANLYKKEADNRQTLSSIDVAKYSFDLTELESSQDKSEQHDQAPVNLKRKLEQIESIANYQEATTSTPTSPTPASPTPASSTPASSIPSSPIPAYSIPRTFMSSSFIKKLFSSENLRDTTNDQINIPAHSHQNENYITFNFVICKFKYHYRIRW